MKYRVMLIGDYDSVIELWARSDGVRLRDADSRASIEAYLIRNPDMSFVAEADGEIVGSVMSCHDGRRGYIQHLSVDAPYRRNGVGKHLVSLCLNALKEQGILKSHVMVLVNNEPARKFWRSQDWVEREDIKLYSYINGGGENT